MSEQCQCKINEPCTCKTQPASDDCCPMPEKLLALADEAWFEVLKEKMKAEIVKSCGDKMDKLAKLVVDANKGKWEHTIQGKVKCEEYKQNLKNFFTTNCKD